VTDARGIGVTLTPLVVVMVGPVGVSAQAPSEPAVDHVALVPPDDAPSQKINRDLRTHHRLMRLAPVHPTYRRPHTS